MFDIYPNWQMESSIKFYPVKSGLSIEGSQGIISKYYISLKINFVLANSADPVEILHYGTFHLGLCCLPWVFAVCQSTCLGVSILFFRP